MTIVNDINAALTAAFPTGSIDVQDPMNDGAHLSATIIAPEFEGLNRVKRHRLVYAALGDAFESKLHALQLTTKAPSEV